MPPKGPAKKPFVVKDGKTAAKLAKVSADTGALIFYKMDGCGHCIYFAENVWNKCPPKMAPMAAEVELSNIPLLPPPLATVNGSPIMGFPTIVFRLAHAGP